MNKLDKFLLSIFSIFLFIIIGFFIYGIIQVKNMKIEVKTVYDEIIKEEYVPYINNSFENLAKMKSTIKTTAKELKNTTIDYNNKLTYNKSIRLEYFDFFIKYKKEIKFIEFLLKNDVYLQDFEKKYFLGRLNKSEKLEHTFDIAEYKTYLTTKKIRDFFLIKKEEKTEVNENKLNNNIDNQDNLNKNSDNIDTILDNNEINQQENSINIDDTNNVSENKIKISEENKKARISFIYDKFKKVVKIKKENGEDSKILYVGRLELFNISNEYIYKIDFIDQPELNRTIGIVHVIGKDLKLKVHFISIEYNYIRGSLKVLNIDNSNNFIQKYNRDECHYVLRYITVVNNEMDVFCYDYIKRNNEKIKLLP